jgi:hypothetical protein
MYSSLGCVRPLPFPQFLPAREAVVYMKLFGIADKKGCVVIPKSATPSRIDANLNGFVNALGKLDKFDIEKLDGVAANGKQKRFIMPPWG